jgi:hypothetical protein
MSLRFPAGYIGKTDITPTGSAFSDAAPGVWTITEALYWKNLGLWPTFGPTAGFDFVDSAATFDERITYTGASARMRFDSTGTLQYAPMNLLTYSEQFDNAAWTKTRSSVTDNTTTAPNGTLTGDTLIPNTDNNTHFIQSSVISFTSGTSYSYTCFVKAAGYSFLRLAFGATAFPSDNRGACFDLSTGAVGATQAGVTASITSAGNGWFRCSISRAATATANDVVFIESKSQDLATPQTFIGDGTSGAFIWGAMLNLGTTAFDYIPTTTAAVYLPRSNAYQDHNPATLAPLGFLIEEQRTNSIRNNTMQGASAGVLPTNWSLTGTETALVSVVGTQTINGVACLIVDVVGTGAGGSFNIFFEAANQVAALNTQVWTASSFFQVISGDFTNIGVAGVYVWEYSAVPTALANSLTSIKTATSSLSRFAVTRTNNQATTAFSRAGITMSSISGAVSVRLAIGLPQLELGAFATSPILTTGAAATRLADVASITGTNFSSFYNQAEGTIVVSATPNANTSQVRVLWSAETNVSERISPFADVTTNRLTAFVIRGVGQASQVTANAFSGTGKAAMAFKEDDIAGCLDGGIVTLDTLATLPTCNQLRIGDRSDGLRCINGHLQSLTYFNRRLPNQTLQSLTV